MDGPWIVVTGGCGFVGHRLCALLAQNDYRVLVVDDGRLGTPDNLPRETRDRVEIIAIDVGRPDELVEALAPFDPIAVFHLAAIHFIPACDRDPAAAIRVNVEGTQGVLDASVRLDSVESVTCASTAAVYAPSDEPHREDSQIGPTDIYGLTKLWMEHLAELAYERTGLPIGIARLFNVFGPGETNPHLLPTIIRQVQAGADLRLGNLDTRRDFVFVDDVARGLMALNQRVVSDGGMTLCNLGSQRDYNGRELVDAVQNAIGRRVTVETDPDRVRKSDRPRLASDCERARDLLGWQAETTLEDGIRAALGRPLATGIEVA